MTVAHVEVLVEEPSAEVALRCLLPRMLGQTSFQIYRHLCKDDLFKRLPERLRGYAVWIPDDWRIVVVVDRDDDDCKKLKRRLDKMVALAGLTTRSGRTVLMLCCADGPADDDPDSARDAQAAAAGGLGG